MSGGYELLCRISATTWISLSLSVSSSGYCCILLRTYLINGRSCSCGWQELAGKVMSIVAGFFYMLNCNESCLVTVMYRKFILMFCSSSREKDNFGLMLLRSEKIECIMDMFWS